MKSDRMLLKVMVTLVAFAVVMFSFSACTFVERPDKTDDNQTASDAQSVQKPDVPDNPITNPKIKDKALKPDTSKIKLEDESKKSVNCTSEAECLKALEKFANPEGNEYDALSVLGSFRYPGSSENDTLEKLKTASDLWHKSITEKVGEKCLVRITADSITPVELSDAAVAEWNDVNGKKAEAFSNVKCYVATNYVDNALKISFDLVKFDGSWYLASPSTLNKIKDVITIELYR